MRSPLPFCRGWVTSLPSRAIVATAAGAMTVLSLPPFSIILLVPVSFSVLLLLLRAGSVGAAALVGWAFGLGQFGFGLSWISESFYVDPDKFGALAIPAVAALAAGLATFPALAAALFSGTTSRHAVTGVTTCLLFATSWTAAEWLRGHVLTGFPWNLTAYALVDYPTLRQPAAWIGSYGLGFLLVLAATLPAAALVTERRRRWVPASLFAAVIATTWTVGQGRLGLEPGPAPGVDVRIVQGNVPQREKWAPEQRDETLTRYLDLSSGPGGVDVLLWPETAFPGFLDEDLRARSRIAAILQDGALLLTGAPDRTRKDQETIYFNTVQAYNQTGDILTGYAKHHLVPFGEYVPFRGWLELDRITQGLGDFTPGAGPRTLTLPGAPPLAVAICYEIIFPGDVIDDQHRPEWIFNATNDAWFGTSIGPEQHLAAVRMRAVEEGLPIVRAANTGISAVIDAKGELIVKLGIEETGVIDAELPGALKPTPYARFGDWTFLALIAVTWIVFLGSRLSGMHRARNKKASAEAKSC